MENKEIINLIQWVGIIISFILMAMLLIKSLFNDIQSFFILICILLISFLGGILISFVISYLKNIKDMKEDFDYYVDNKMV